MVIVPRHNKLADTNRSIKDAQRGVKSYLEQLSAISALPPDPTIASLPLTKQEQTDFLRGLSQLCALTKNKLVQINSLAAAPPPPAPAAGSNAPPPPKTGLPPDVLAIKSTVVFEGSFQSLQAFLGGLHGSRRLIALADCRIGAGEGGFPMIRTTLTVTRFVDIPPSAQPPAAPPAAPTA